jgi:hypothetical protein
MLARLILFLVIGTARAGGFQVAFDTAECNGDTGFVSVELDRVYRVETIECGPEY